MLFGVGVDASPGVVVDAMGLNARRVKNGRWHVLTVGDERVMQQWNGGSS